MQTNDVWYCWSLNYFIWRIDFCNDSDSEKCLKGEVASCLILKLLLYVVLIMYHIIIYNMYYKIIFTIENSIWKVRLLLDVWCCWTLNCFIWRIHFCNDSGTEEVNMYYMSLLKNVWKVRLLLVVWCWNLGRFLWGMYFCNYTAKKLTCII